MPATDGGDERLSSNLRAALSGAAATAIERRVRWLVLVTVMIGVAGLPLALLFGEPFPWIAMPGFEGNGGFDGHAVERSTVAFIIRFADSGSATVDPPAMFGEVPASAHATFVSRFAPSAPQGRKFEHVVEALVPQVHAASRRPIDGNDPELRGWLRHQASRLFPDRLPVAVDVEWQRLSIDMTGAPQVITSERTARVDL